MSIGGYLLCPFISLMIPVPDCLEPMAIGAKGLEVVRVVV
jgi:hypothetical protein